jgi:hypothetical protein
MGIKNNKYLLNIPPTQPKGRMCVRTQTTPYPVEPMLMHPTAIKGISAPFAQKPSFP